MAVYKVIQDIEAEDKLLGPLTLKGFIYASITVFLGFINFQLVKAGGLGNFRWPLLLIFLLPMLLFATLASPLGRDQPTEVWLLSHIRFLLKSRIRIWNQSGIKELVTITVPKKIDKHLIKDISQTEVKSRLKTLATTLDSRGWAVKNVAVDSSSLVSYLQGAAGDSDRLIGASSVMQTQPVVDVHPSDDILDEQNNAKAQQMEQLLVKEDEQRKKDIGDEMKAATQPTAASQRPIVKSTPPAQTAKLKELAQSGNALSVASVAKLANRVGQIQQVGPNEVVISLH